MSADRPARPGASPPGAEAAGARLGAGLAWPAAVLQEAIQPLLPGFTFEVLPEVDSTNSELMRRGRAGRTAPVLLAAEHQSAGRGRLGRVWLSGASRDPGGTGAAGAVLPALTFSLALPLAPADWSGLSLAVGVSLAESLHPAIQLKWPNDLWLSERKLAGILIETASFGEGAGSRRRYAVIGIGINLAAPPAAGLSIPPAGLQELLPGLPAGAVLSRVAPPLVRDLQIFETFGFAPFRARFNARDALRERPVVLSDGTAGTAHGTDEKGGLLVHTARGMTTVTSSEVSVRHAA